MTLELIHTSVPKDVDGRVGFGVAAMTQHMPLPLVQELAAMSDLGSDEAAMPGWSRFSYVVVSAGGKSHSVVSRVGGCGPDYSGRPNRVAHHLVVEPQERPQTSPAVLLRAFQFEQCVPAVGRRPNGPMLPRPIALSGDLPGGTALWGRHLAPRLAESRLLVVVTGFPAGGALVALQALYAAFGPEKVWKIQCATRPGARFNPNLPMIFALDAASDIARVRAAHPASQVIDLSAPPPVEAATTSVPRPGSVPAGPGRPVPVVPPSAPAPARPSGPGSPPPSSSIPIQLAPGHPVARGSVRPAESGHRQTASQGALGGLEPALVTDIMIVLGGIMMITALVILVVKGW